MASSSITLIAVIVVLLILSAYFSATETAFSSVNRIRLKNMAANGNKRAETVLKLSEDYSKVLSTILIGNNIVNIASATLATVLFVKYWGDAGATISTVAMTFLVLLFSEITPKSLAKETPERFAMFSVPFLRFFMVLLTPLNFLFSLWKKLLSKLFRSRGDQKITEEELLTIVEEAQQEGGINQQEGELIRSAIEFNELEASDIVTPRVDIVAVEEKSTPEEVAAVFRDSGFSRLPVFQGSLDNIIGVLHQKDFYRMFGQKDFCLAALVKPVVYVIPSARISKLLRQLQQINSHLAIVTDEFGGTIGLVTLEDILEELVGEIWDEHDEVIQEFVPLGEGLYKIMCGASIDKLFDLFHITEETEVSSVSGWVIEQMGHIPVEGESFSYENLVITVHKTDGKRVQEILVTMRPASEESQQEKEDENSRRSEKKRNNKEEKG